jgi:lactate permease
VNLLAASPLILLILLIFGLRWTLVRSGPVVFMFTAFIAFWGWNLSGGELISASFKGFLLSLDIVLIVFGAILFVLFLRQTGALNKVEAALERLSPLKEHQAILLAWPFGSFIEGISGFGTSGAILAPFLVGIGFKPLTSMLIVLVANSTAVTFGAVGTPVRVGLAGLINSDFSSLAATINFLPGLLIPFFILGFAVQERETERWKHYKHSMPFALFAGLSFLLPYVFFARFGSDYPSLLGGAMSLPLCCLYLTRAWSKLKLLLMAFAPYIFLIVTLVVGKKAFEDFNYVVNLGSGLQHTVRTFNPGFAFLTVMLVLNVRYAQPLSSFSTLAKTASSSLIKAFASIFFFGSITYVLVVSGMIKMLAQNLTGPKLPFYSAFIGAFGSFLAGSATVSNLLFGGLQQQAALEVGLGVSTILALQLTGAAAGNMIALPNILAVQAAVREEGMERVGLMKLVLPCVAYIVCATLAVFIFF